MKKNTVSLAIHIAKVGKYSDKCFFLKVNINSETSYHLPFSLKLISLVTMYYIDGVYRPDITGSIRIDASKTNAMSARIPVAQRQAALIDSEPLENVDTLKYLSLMLVANAQNQN